MGLLKFMGQDLDPKKAHVNIEVKFKTWGIFPIFITGQKTKIHLSIGNVGAKPIESTNFRWEIHNEISKITNKQHIQFSDIPDINLHRYNNYIKYTFPFEPEISGLHLLIITMADESKKGTVGFHSGNNHFESDYAKHFQSHSWYLVVGGFGSILLIILTLLQIIRMTSPILSKLM